MPCPEKVSCTLAAPATLPQRGHSPPDLAETRAPSSLAARHGGWQTPHDARYLPRLDRSGRDFRAGRDLRTPARKTRCHGAFALVRFVEVIRTGGSHSAFPLQ